MRVRRDGRDHEPERTAAPRPRPEPSPGSLLDAAAPAPAPGRAPSTGAQGPPGSPGPPGPSSPPGLPGATGAAGEPVAAPDDLRRAVHSTRPHRPWSQRGVLNRMLWRVAVVSWLAFLVFGLAVTPRAVGALLRGDELPGAILTRERIGQRLSMLRDGFLLLARDVEEERARVEKIRVAYGLGARPPHTEETVDPGSFPSSVYLPLIEETATLATRVRIDVVELEARVAELRSFERARPDLVALTPALSPLASEFVVTASFGFRKSTFTEAQEFHSGVDLAAAVGTPVVAPGGGKVVFAGRFPVSRRSTWWRLGTVVALRHGEGLVTLYGHLGRVVVRRGQAVARGDRLSEIGESGVLEHPHLHYSVWRRAEDGGFEPVDPRPFMLDRHWDDEEELLATAAVPVRAGDYEPLPRQLR